MLRGEAYRVVAVTLLAGSSNTRPEAIVVPRRLPSASVSLAPPRPPQHACRVLQHPSLRLRLHRRIQDPGVRIYDDDNRVHVTGDVTPEGVLAEMITSAAQMTAQQPEPAI